MTGILAYLRSFHHLTASSDNDGVLLQRFRLQRDEQAFAALVQRHGALVLSMARSASRDMDIADDVFQATFVVLAKRGKLMESWPSVAGWLVQVTRRTAMQAMTKAARRQSHEQQVITMSSPLDPSVAAEQRELVSLMDAELARLPSKYRTPIVLCQLQGQTKEETARQLGWPVGSVSGRLVRGKKILAARLMKRGVVPSLLAGMMTLPRVEAQLSPLLVQATTLLASQNAHRTGAISKCTALTLAQGVLTTMWIGKVKSVAVATLLVGMLAASGLWAWTGVSNAQPAFAVSIQAKTGARGNEELAALNGSWIIEETKAGTNTAWVGPRAVNERHYWLFDRDQFQVRATYFSSEMQLYIDKPVFFDSRLPHRRFQLDSSTNPCRILIESSKMNEVLIKGIIKIENDQLLIHFVYDADKDYPADFQLTPHSVLLKARRATDYDRLEGIWRQEERNPVTNDLDRATELIFRKNMYVRRVYTASSIMEDTPCKFQLDEKTSPKQLDLEIRSTEDAMSRLATSLHDANIERFRNQIVNRDRVLERRLAVYELTTDELRYAITGAIPFKLDGKQLVPHTESALNKRARSLETAGSPVLAFKRVASSLKSEGKRTPITEIPVEEPSGSGIKAQPAKSRNLLEERLKLAEERMVLWKQAMASGSPNGSIDHLSRISEQLATAKLALAQTQSEKIQVMEAHLQNLRQVEQVAEVRYKSGGILKSEFLDISLRRIEYEIKLDEAKVNQQ